MKVEVNTMCIIGAGTMGTGIAQVAAQAGIYIAPRNESRVDVSIWRT